MSEPDPNPVPCFACMGKKRVIVRATDDAAPVRVPCPTCGATGDLSTVSPVDIRKKADAEGVTISALIERLRRRTRKVMTVEKCVNCDGKGKTPFHVRGMDPTCPTCEGLGHVAMPELDLDALDEVEELFEVES